MDEGLSMRSRAEITVKYAKGYVKASKKDRGRMLDEVVAVTGWSRGNARRRLVAGAKAGPASKGKRAVAWPRKPRARKYSSDAVKVLQRVWAASGGQWRAVREVPGGVDAGPARRACLHGSHLRSGIAGDRVTGGRALARTRCEQPQECRPDEQQPAGPDEP